MLEISRLKALGRTLMSGMPARLVFSVRLRSLASWRSWSKTGAEVETAGIFQRLAAREGEIAFQHGLHVVDVFVQGGDVGLAAAQRQLQLEACQDGAKVVADARQHGGALLDLTLDAPAHHDEGVAGAAHFGGSARLEIARHGPALAETLRRFRSCRIGRI